MPGAQRRGVFLSYRRDDAGPYARLLQQQLSQRIPDARIFMDLDSIEPGLDFAEVIEDAVNSSAVLVALIGRQWLTLTGEDGARRLDNPDDYVRFEVTTALERGVRVIPVLIDGARALRRQDLPEELHKLARLNAAKLSYDRYQDDADRLLDLIQRVLPPVGKEPLAAGKREDDPHKTISQRIGSSDQGSSSTLDRIGPPPPSDEGDKLPKNSHADTRASSPARQQPSGVSLPRAEPQNKIVSAADAVKLLGKKGVKATDETLSA
jgi:hypothetical protein